ncbi:MAG TPA: TerC family protein [Burkholderiales bacterium]|nr:TerC family protein [Burkholderiales bacterium]
MDLVQDSQFWLGLLEIVGVNIVLSGDNAVVIALASRSLPKHQQRMAIVAGSAAAIVLRIVLTTVAAQVLSLPYLKLAGALLLLWIGVQLLLPEADEDGKGAKAASHLMGAVRTILIADLVMSLDNVIAVAAAAHGNLVLLILGLAISIPLIVFGSTAVLKLMERFPIVVSIGAGLLGYVAGDMLLSEPVLDAQAWPEVVHIAAPWMGAAIVVGIGRWLASRRIRVEATDR